VPSLKWSDRTIWVAGLGLVALAAVVGAARLLGIGSPAASAAGPPPRLVDTTAGSGLTHTFDGPYEFAVGGGVAVLDCDADGRPDLYLAGGANPAGLFHNESATGGALQFSRRADPVTDLTGVNGAYPIDVDSDGVTDLIVLRNGENVALRGLGGCRFERANEAWGIDGGSDPTEAFSATWEAGAAWPTLAFGNYVDDSIKDPTRWCQPNFLFRPSGGPLPYGPAVALQPSWCTLSMLFSDWDGSGRRDLRVSNDVHYYPIDAGMEQLWRVEPGAAPRLYTAAEGWATLHIQGMGIGSYDVTGDGLPEVYLTSQGANRLQTLAAGPGKPAYADIGATRDATIPYPVVGDTNLPSTAWHPEFADVNNDGLMDLFVSKGNVSEQPDYAIKDPSNLLLGQPDGLFRDVTEASGIVNFGRGRGAALADFNLDGRLDLVESFYGAPVTLWRNDGPIDGADASGGASGTGAADGAHWLAVRVEQPGPNVDVIGGWIEVQAGGRTDRRELTIGGGHAGGQLGWVHFGLGAATEAQVRIRWPDGVVGAWQRVEPNGFVIVDRASGLAGRWDPPAT
jgi:enediyne biosynthesis protein E4